MSTDDILMRLSMDVQQVLASVASFRDKFVKGFSDIGDAAKRAVPEVDTVAQAAETLGGAKTIKGAQDYAKAVEQIGGVSKLTSSEKARLNAQLKESLDKYNALGQQAPQNMRDLEVATRAVVSPTEKLHEAQDKLRSMGDSMTRIGAGLTAGLTVPIVGAGAAVVKLGMDAVESENLVVVSFGDMKGAADAWAAGLSKNLGLNRFETKAMAGTLFNMTTSMGLSRDAAFNMSTGVVKLSADMASFRNIPMEEALLKIRSGLVGEAEPLKAIGILVNDATIKTYAYANGIAKQGQELTEQQKVMARWGAILQQTSNDQGDLARTLESPANQLRIMRSRIEEAATALGVSLMPMVTRVISGVSELVTAVTAAVDGFTKLPESVQYGALSLLSLLAAAGPVLLIVGQITVAVAAALPLIAALGGGAAVVTSALTFAAGAAAALTAGLAGWMVGGLIRKAINLVVDLDGAVAKLAVSLGFYGDAGAAAAASKTETLRLATQRAGRAITDYTEAIRINQEWAEKQIAKNTQTTKTVDDGSTAYAKQKAAALALVKEALTPLTAQERELVLIRAKGGESADQISKALGLNEAAVKRLLDTQKKATTASDEQAKAAKALELALIPLTAAQQERALQDQRAGVSATDTAKALRISADAVSKYLESVKSGERIAKIWKDFHEGIADASKKFFDKYVADTNAMHRKVADGTAAALVDQLQTYRAYQEKNHQLTLDGTALAVRQLELERDAKIEALKTKANFESGYYAKAKAEIDKNYQHQIAVATGAASTIEERMRSQGVRTKTELQDMAAAAKRDYKQMLASGLYTTDQLAVAWKRMVDANRAAMTGWRGAFQDTLDGFIQSLGSGAGLIGSLKAFGTQTVKDFTAGMLSAIPGVGPALSQLAGPLVDGFKKLFGGLFGTAGRDAVKEFAASFKGGFDGPGGLHEALLASGEAGEAMWKKLSSVGRNDGEKAKALIAEATQLIADQKAKTDALTASHNTQLGSLITAAGTWRSLPAEMTPYIDKLEKAGLLTKENADALRAMGDFGADDFDRLKSKADAFGVSLAAMGPAFQQAGLDRSAKDIIGFFDEMIGRGGDYNGLLVGLQEEISGVVQQSIKFGTVIPGNMKPWIDDLAKSGRLLDENGNKITDVSGLKFGENIKVGLEDVVSKLQELIDLFAKGLPGAVGAVDKSLAGNKGAWDDWRKYAKDALEDVQGEVDAVSFGNSPGGLKEIPLMLAKAVTATGAFARHALDQFGNVQDTVDGMGLFGLSPAFAGVSGVSASGGSGGGGNVTIVIEEGAIDASGSFFTDAAGIRKLTKAVGDELADRFKLTRKVGMR